MRLFKTAAIGAIAALAVTIGWLGSQALAGTSSQTPLHISNVFIGPPSSHAAARAARQNWIGDSVSDVENMLGQPSQIYRLKDTGGEMLIYTYPYPKHYVFEAEPH